ncbi:uncharacterized protein LOC144093953 isoform X3 [Amblyomma americanum]
MDVPFCKCYVSTQVSRQRVERPTAREIKCTPRWSVRFWRPHSSGTTMWARHLYSHAAHFDTIRLYHTVVHPTLV